MADLRPQLHQRNPPRPYPRTTPVPWWLALERPLPILEGSDIETLWTATVVAYYYLDPPELSDHASSAEVLLLLPLLTLVLLLHWKTDGESNLVNPRGQQTHRRESLKERQWLQGLGKILEGVVVVFSSLACVCTEVVGTGPQQKLWGHPILQAPLNSRDRRQSPHLALETDSRDRRQLLPKRWSDWE